MSQRSIWRAAALTILVVAAALASASLAMPVVAAQPGASPRPSSSGLTASPNPDDVGVSATFDASSLCQVALTGCSYSYAGLPTGCSTADTSSLTCTPSASGQTTVNATVTWGCPVCISSSSTVSFTVNADPVVSSMSASPSTVDVGQLLTLQASISGGTSPFGYSWSGLPSGCSSVNSSSLSCRPGTSGTTTIGVSVRDAVGSQTSGSLALTVNSRLGATLSVAPAVRDVGGSVTFTATTSGGQSPYTLAYSNLPPGCSSSDVSSLPCTPTATGTYHVNVTVTDAVGGSASASAQLQVVPPPTVTLTVSPTPIDVGQSATFQVTVSGGSAPYAFVYSNLPSGCTSANTSSLKCTPTASGTFSVAVSATDAEGSGASGTASFTVNPALSAAISANVSSGFTPLPVSFSSVVSGGTAPLVYAWQFAPNAKSNLTAPRYVFVAGGNFSVSLTVTDATGASVTAFYPVSVRSSATYVTYPINFFVNPAGCGPITLNSVLQDDGSTAQLPASTFTALAPVCPGFAFTQWVPNGGIQVESSAASSTTVSVSSSGSLTAVFSVVATHHPPTGGGSSLRSFSSWAPYLPLLVGGGVALFLLKGFYDRRNGARRSPPRSDRPGSPGSPAIGGSWPPTTPAPSAGGAWRARVERLPSQVQERLRQALRWLPLTARAAGAPGGTQDPVGMSVPVNFAPSQVPPTEHIEFSPTGSALSAAHPIATAPATGSPSVARLSVASWIPPPPPPPPPIASRARSPSDSPPATSHAEAVDLGLDRRSWPPSGIWEMAPTPNSPNKRARDRRRADDP
ncbi:MAG TPA: PKD domain-containing protein [Thermoplasmata archaeon]|nr:PKD domain-containing protein [Thermoplasmata archaeon]